MVYARDIWVDAFLEKMGNKSPTDGTHTWVKAWTFFETTRDALHVASFNLLNTTEEYKPDGTRYTTTNFNTFGPNGEYHVLNYASFADGIEANARVLRNGDYPVLCTALQTNDEAALQAAASNDIAKELDTWGTHHAADIVALANDKAGLVSTEEFPGDGPIPPSLPVTPASPVSPATETSTTLATFPLVSQLTQITSDGRKSENGPYDCVAASIGASILWYEHKSQWDTSINPDKLKDLAYGENYKNEGTSAKAYVPYVAQLGYHLTSVENASYQSAVARVHQLLAAQQPVIFTMVDHYVSLSLGWTHCCVFYAGSPGELVALDPYISKPIRYTDSEWESELRSTELWVVTPLEVPAMLITDLTISNYFTIVNGDSLQRKDTGVLMKAGITAFYLKYGGPGVFGLPLTSEIAVKDASGAIIPDVVYVVAERAVLVWDPRKVIDRPPTNESCYLMHIDSGPGQTIISKPVTAPLQAQITDLNKQLMAAQQALKTAVADPTVTVLQQELADYAKRFGAIAAQLPTLPGA